MLTFKEFNRVEKKYGYKLVNTFIEKILLKKYKFKENFILGFIKLFLKNNKYWYILK